MATINEFADDFSQRIRTAVGRDGLTAQAIISERNLRNSFTLRALRRIAHEMALFTVEKPGDQERAIAEDEKNAIIDETAEKLGVTDRQVLRRVFNEAGSQNFVSLTQDLNQLVREIKQ